MIKIRPLLSLGFLILFLFIFTNVHISKVNAQTTTAPTTDTTDTTSESCESEGGEFSFFLCPALRGANEGIETLDGRIREMLEVNPEYLLDEADGSSGGVRAAWSRIRNVAYIILIPVMLLMVIGTALQFSFVDAYTVKRALPRMLVAVIFMAISFDFARIMIEATNEIGRGVGGLISQPFGGASNLELTDIFEPGVGEDAFLASSGFVAGVAIATIGIVSLGIIGSYLLVSVLTLIIVFFILTLRELLLVFLVIMSPLAIISWIFPGNDKLWKLWWNTFSKLLLLYPLIISILMVGRGFASIVNSTTGASDSGSWITTLVKITAYIGPFFFIPKAFQYAGGAFANLAGMVNDRGKGLFDRQRKYRADKRKGNYEDWQNGNRFKRAGKVGSKLNTIGEYYGQRDKLGKISEMKKWRGNLQQAVLTAQHDHTAEAAKHSSAARIIEGDDDVKAAAAFHTREEREAELERRSPGRFSGDENKIARERALSVIEQAEKDLGHGVYQRWIVQQQPGTGTSYQYGYDSIEEDLDASGNLQYEADGVTVKMKKVRKEGVDVLQMLDEIDWAYGDDDVGAGNALAKMRGAAVQAGQVIVGKAGYATMAGARADLRKLASDRANGSINETQYLAERDRIRDAIEQDAFDSATPQEMIYGKPTSAARFGAVLAKRIKSQASNLSQYETELEDAKADHAAGRISTDQLNVAQTKVQSAQKLLSGSTAAASALWDAMRAASPQNASAFANELMGQEIDDVTLTKVETKTVYNPTTGTPQIDPASGQPVVVSERVGSKKKRVIRELISELPTSEQGDEFVNRYRDWSADQLAKSGGAPPAGVSSPPSAPKAPGGP
jgi:hypothetical protein